MKNKILNYLLSFLATLGLAMGFGCGSDDDTTVVQLQQDTGRYAAELKTLNPKVSGNNANGRVTIQEINGELRVSLRMGGLVPSTVHLQHLQTGTSCPSASSDRNGDGFVDVLEGIEAFGEILLPLDGELSAQQLGASNFPSSNESGFYQYVGSAQLAGLLADLRAPDPNSQDFVVKLNSGEELNLMGKQVVVYGVSANTRLPDSVVALEGFSKQQSLPIACGTLVAQQDVDQGSDGGTGGSGGTTVGGTSGGGGGEWPWDETFGKRLNSNLLISGKRCEGNDIRIRRADQDPVTCREGQWLVIVDNLNTCTRDGVCTEIAVQPIIAKLERSQKFQTGAYYAINPLVGATAKQKEILKNYWVKFQEGEEPKLKLRP